ncbi:MAG: hypothetical protein AAGI66_00870 [Cyanobacteria bacterium P01_H01_bin.74]
MAYETSTTSAFRNQYNKVDRRLRRIVDDAVEIIKEFPTDYQHKITYISKRKEGGLYRFRVPGCHIFYILPEKETEKPNTIILTAVKPLR